MSQNKSKPKKILFPLCEKEIAATESRILRLVKSLAEAGHSIDILTRDHSVADLVTETFGAVEAIKLYHKMPDERFWTMQERDSFAKTFTKLNHDLTMPGTEIKYWKLAAFDDFLWNVSAGVYPKLDKLYDLIVFPIPSVSQPPSVTADVLNTHVIYYAKEHQLPIVGLQVHPIFDIPDVYHWLVDYVVVKEHFERQYYVDYGFQPERVFVVDDIIDRYCLATVQDVYLDLALKSEIKVGKNQLVVALVNHAKNRYPLYEIIDAIAQFHGEKVVFFDMLNYAVKDLHERDIFDDLIRPKLEQKIGAFYTADEHALVETLMLCDVFLSTSYMVQSSFATRYGKTAVVHNPLIQKVPYIKGVIYTESKDELLRHITEQYERKRSQRTVTQIIAGIPNGY